MTYRNDDGDDLHKAIGEEMHCNNIQGYKDKLMASFSSVKYKVNGGLIAVLEITAL